MKVYKFGGASVRNADGVQNLLKIIGDERDLFIIVSAMGKTTNALEKVFEGLQKGDKAFSMEHITALRQYHAEIVNELYGAPTRLEKIERLFGELEQVATETVYRPEDAELWYDTVVAFGELISTTIISEYLSERGSTIAGSICDAASAPNSDTRTPRSISPHRGLCCATP